VQYVHREVASIQVVPKTILMATIKLGLQNDLKEIVEATLMLAMGLFQTPLPKRTPHYRASLHGIPTDVELPTDVTGANREDPVFTKPRMLLRPYRCRYKCGTNLADTRAFKPTSATSTKITAVL